MSEQKNAHVSGTSQTPAAAGGKSQQPTSPGDLTFVSFSTVPETVEGAIATSTGLVDSVGGPVGYKPGDLIVKDPASAPDKQLYYIIPAEVAREKWAPSSAAPTTAAKDETEATHKSHK